MIRDYQSNNITIHGDYHKLGQVFLNLFQNAIDAMPRGGCLAVSCEFSAMPGSNNKAILVKVKDTGFGISKEDLTKIFDPFFTKKRTGIGLGLAVSHQIIKNHRGITYAESEQGKGTTFYVFLPIEKFPKDRNNYVSRLIRRKNG